MGCRSASGIAGARRQVSRGISTSGFTSGDAAPPLGRSPWGVHASTLCGILYFMNKKLESIIDRVLTWPEEAQDEALRALTAIEEKHVRVQPSIDEEQERKLTSLRDTIN